MDVRRPRESYVLKIRSFLQTPGSKSRLSLSNEPERNPGFGLHGQLADLAGWFLGPGTPTPLASPAS